MRLYSVDCEDSWLLILALSSVLVSTSVDTTPDSGWGCEVQDDLRDFFRLHPVFCSGMYTPGRTIQESLQWSVQSLLLIGGVWY